jgi:hypothetical protein
MLGQASAGVGAAPVSLRPKLPVKSVAAGRLEQRRRRILHEHPAKDENLSKRPKSRYNNPLGRKGAFELASLIRKRNQTNQIQTKLLTSGPGGRRFKSSLPDQLFSRSFNRLRRLLPVSLFGKFRYIRYNRRQFKAEATLLSPLSAEGNVLFDFVVEVAHVLSRMTHPVLVKTFGAVGIVPQVRVSEATESMAPRVGIPWRQINARILMRYLSV